MAIVKKTFEEFLYRNTPIADRRVAFLPSSHFLLHGVQVFIMVAWLRKREVRGVRGSLVNSPVKRRKRAYFYVLKDRNPDDWSAPS